MISGKKVHILFNFSCGLVYRIIPFYNSFIYIYFSASEESNVFGDPVDFTYQSTHWAFRPRETPKSYITIRPLFERKRSYKSPCVVANGQNKDKNALIYHLLQSNSWFASHYLPLALEIPANQPFRDSQIPPTRSKHENITITYL